MQMSRRRNKDPSRKNRIVARLQAAEPAVPNREDVSERGRRTSRQPFTHRPVFWLRTFRQPPSRLTAVACGQRQRRSHTAARPRRILTDFPSSRVWKKQMLLGNSQRASQPPGGLRDNIASARIESSDVHADLVTEVTRPAMNFIPMRAVPSPPRRSRRPRRPEAMGL
jgi:hypothetical protein